MHLRVVYLAALILSGCAANTVRIEHAGTVSTQAAEVVKGTKAYVATVQARRRDAVIALVASDPSCKWGSTLYMDTQWTPRPPPAPAVGLCDVSHVPEERRVPIDLRPIQPEALKALTLTVAGVATYQAALAEILADKPTDAKQDIDTALSTLTTATADLNRIAGSKLIDLGQLLTDRSKTMKGLIGTLIELQQTQLKVDKVNKVVGATNTTALIDDLNTALANLSRLQAANSETYALLGVKMAYANEAPHSTFAERTELIRQIATADDAFEDAKLGRVADLTTATTALGEQDQQLRRALAGDFTPEERRRIALDNIKQAFSLLSQIAALFPAL